MEATKKILVGMSIVAMVVFGFFALWYVFFRTPAPTATTLGTTTIKNSQSFTTANTQTSETPISNQPIDSTGINPDQKIFKIADGPVMAATFIVLSNPTTTLVRYTKQDSGHVFDIPVNVPGAISRVVSNTTIPGLATGLWLPGGNGTILQYEENRIIKTVALSFPPASSVSATTTIRVNFLPNNIVAVAASPDGRQIAYLVPVSGGVVGYIANTNGTNAKRFFSLPFSQVLLSWPSLKTLLVQTKEANGVPGIAFSISTKGSISPLIYAKSLSATANVIFSKVVYQSTQNANELRQTFVHDVQHGKDEVLPFNPFPEKCIWSSTVTTAMYCAAPLASTPTNYLDLWHQGLTSAADSVFLFDVNSNITSLVAQPGSAQGGTQADIDQLAVSQDSEYLLYITRGDRTLWGVKIGR